MLAALRDGDLREAAIRMYNVLEETDDRRMRTIAEIKNTLLDYGALGAVMTGTGSAVFGVFQEEQAAADCTERLAAEYRFCRNAEPVGRLKI